MSKNKLQGFDYRAGATTERPRRDWRDDLAQAVSAGGYRRVEHGETFVHGPDGRLLFEVYAALPAPRAHT